MNIYIKNVSTVLDDIDIKCLHAPLIIYTRHIRTWWGSMQPGIFFGDPVPMNAWQIIIADDSDQAGALGYHYVTPDGRPISYVFAKTDLDYGYDWQVTLTHELAEMLLDPYVMRCEQTADARFHALELCDPVETDSLAYKITAGGYNLTASNFITPYWFVPEAKGQYDMRGACTNPLQVLSGGYAYYWENGQWYSEDHFGRKYTVEEFADAQPNKTRLSKYARRAKEVNDAKPDRYINTFVGKDKQWYFTVYADNGEAIVQSEGYVKAQDMHDTINKYFNGWPVMLEHKPLEGDK